MLNWYAYHLVSSVADHVGVGCFDTPEPLTVAEFLPYLKLMPRNIQPILMKIAKDKHAHVCSLLQAKNKLDAEKLSMILQVGVSLQDYMVDKLWYDLEEYKMDKNVIMQTIEVLSRTGLKIAPPPNKRADGSVKDEPEIPVLMETKEK